MVQTTIGTLGPEFTPLPIKRIIITTCAISIITALLYPYIDLQYLLGLSWQGFSSYYFWQPITYLFIQPHSNVFSLWFFFRLFFQMYLLWFIGSDLFYKLGSTSLVFLYFFSGVITAFICLLLMPIFNPFVFLAGPSAPLLTLGFIWVMYHAHTELLLFFLFQIKAKWIFAAFFAFYFLPLLASADIIGILYVITPLLIGYLYGTAFLGLTSPYLFFHKIDVFFIRLGDKLRLLKETISSKKNFLHQKTKIFDFKTGNPVLNDEAFMDAMLEKISKYGANSLSWKEKRRMNKISKKLNNKK